MRAARSRSSSVRRVRTDLKDLFAIFPDMPWPRPSRRWLADQIRLARWRAGMSRLVGVRTLAATETMAALVRARRS
jgi:hypothetical protein